MSSLFSRFVIPKRAQTLNFVIPNTRKARVRNLLFRRLRSEQTPPYSSIPIPKREARSSEHQKNKPVEIPESRIARVGRTLLPALSEAEGSDALTLILI